MLKMKKITLLLASLFLVACGHDWSEGDEKDWMDECKDKNMSTDFCSCIWDMKTSHWNSEDEFNDYVERRESDELEDSDIDNMRSAAKAFIDCIEDKDLPKELKRMF